MTNGEVNRTRLMDCPRPNKKTEQEETGIVPGLTVPPKF